jgi:RNA polymerase sigma-70 factor, ECF subfamily
MATASALCVAPIVAMTLDADELDRLYVANADRLARYFQRRVQDPEVAVDLVAETFTRVAERLDQFRGGQNNGDASGWLWRVAASTLHEHERRDAITRRRKGRLAIERRALTEEEYERIEADASSEALRAAVRASLKRLPAAEREAVQLRVVEGLPYSEVAERLGIKQTAAQMRVGRAMRHLRGMLERIYEREEGRP